MALTEKGTIALACVKKHFPEGQFTAKELSDACGEKIMAATLNGVVNNGYLIKIGGTPVIYESIPEMIESFQPSGKHGCDNTNLADAKKAKNDEFYTKYEDIESEVMKYRRQFRDKVVYLPCDDPAEKKSQFWSFFVSNFDSFGLKKLIATHYDKCGKAYKIWIEDDINGDGYIDDEDALQEELEGDGDFRSLECTNILNESDIVVTNPPFSLFRDFVSWIMKAEKQFLIIGNQNAFTYKEIFPLIKNNKIWTGYNMVKAFYQPDGSIKKFGNVCWFTNLHTSKRVEKLILTKKYNEHIYPTYDNYNAIEVSRCADIPSNYKGMMGVPITFLDHYNPEQFEIIGCTAYSDETFDGMGAMYVNKNKKYARAIIKTID